MFDFRSYLIGGKTEISAPLLRKVLELQPNGIYIIQGEEYRPDLLAYRIFGDTRLWWMILYFNRLSSILELKNGTPIRFPAIEDLERIFIDEKIYLMQEKKGV